MSKDSLYMCKTLTVLQKFEREVMLTGVFTKTTLHVNLELRHNATKEVGYHQEAQGILMHCIPPH